MPVLAYKYRFGPYEVRVPTRELFKHGTRLKLRRQPFQVLQALVERAGDVVTREELRQRLWPAETFVDFEHGLNTSVKELRRVLSDSASEPRYIETIPKLGYRIAAAVAAEGAPSIASVRGLQPLEDTVRDSNSPLPQPNRWWR
jgi:DNA-binding winged helix-turn-helix (wHTH) protein